MNKFLLSVACLAAMLSLPVAHAQSAAPTDAGAPAPADDALFRALGGQAGIDRIVGDFVPRLLTDPRTAEFFKKTDQPHFKLMLEQQFCVVSGGACTYTGLPMKKAHENIDVSKGDFNALVEVLQAAMSAQGVAFSTQNQLLARLAPMHREIVNVH